MCCENVQRLSSAKASLAHRDAETNEFYKKMCNENVRAQLVED